MAKPHLKEYVTIDLDGYKFGLTFEDHDGREKLLIWTLFPEDELVSVLLSEEEARILQIMLNQKYGIENG